MEIFRTLLLIAVTVMTAVPATAQKKLLADADDSLSYALGVANYRYYEGDNININAKLFSKGMTDASKEKAVMDETEASTFIVSYMQRREKERLMTEYSQQIDSARAWLEENARAEGVVVTESGLQYRMLKEGDGSMPGPDDIVRVHYTGKTTGGSQFDSSYERGEPAQFRLNQVISGWTEGLSLMKEGAQAILFIPYQLAYGERGAGNIIKPFETLIFEVELLEVIKDDEQR